MVKRHGPFTKKSTENCTIYVQHKPHAQITRSESHCFQKTNYFLIYSLLLKCWLRILRSSHFRSQTTLHEEAETVRTMKYL